jgi:hypothetical protein
METYNGTLYATNIKEARQLVRKATYVEADVRTRHDVMSIETTKAAALRSLKPMPSDMECNVRLYTFKDGSGETLCTIG